MYANVSLEKPIFTFIKHFSWMIPFYYYSQSCEFNDSWTNDSPYFPFFCFFILFKNLINFFFHKTHLWNIGHFFFENAFMNAWDFWECIYDICLNDVFFWKNAFMNAWLFFWNVCMIYVWMNFFYGCMHRKKSFLKMHIWMEFLRMHIRCTKF